MTLNHADEIFERFGYDPDDPVRDQDVPDRLSEALSESAASTPCSICLGSGRVFKYRIVDPRDHPPITSTHAVPMGEPCPNCKGAGRV